MEPKDSRDWFWFSVFIVLVLLQIGDALSTYILATKPPPGTGMEANPVVRYAFEKLGLLNGMIVAKSVAIVVSYIIYAWTAYKTGAGRTARVGLVFLVLAYTFVNVHNWDLVFTLRNLGLI